MHQSLHQRGQQGLQLEAGLHQLFDTRHHGGVAGEHLPLRRHHVRDERVASTLLLMDDNLSISDSCSGSKSEETYFKDLLTLRKAP